MKTKNLLPLIIFSFLFFACMPTTKVNAEALYNNAWELEYISGPRIAFAGLYPDKKPRVTFNKMSGKVEGTNSCNGYSADFKLDGKNISFGEPGPTTMMFCGEGEKVFLKTMKMVDSYNIDAAGKLNLLLNNVPMMTFKKSAAN